MKYIFVLVYVLVLATQLPHVWSAYASLEQPGVPFAAWTSVGAALAFELSTGVFTYRIVSGSRRKWTRRGLWFFIVASIVANGFYYGWLRSAFDRIWPVFATVALPLSLALFAEEFGAEVKREERAAKRDERKQNEPDTADKWLGCETCGRVFAWPSQYANERSARNAMNAHKRAHLRKVER